MFSRWGVVVFVWRTSLKRDFDTRADASASQRVQKHIVRRRKHGPSCPQPGRIAAGRPDPRSPRVRTTKSRTLLAKSNTIKWQSTVTQLFLRYTMSSSPRSRDFAFGKGIKHTTRRGSTVLGTKNLQRSAMATHVSPHSAPNDIREKERPPVFAWLLNLTPRLCFWKRYSSELGSALPVQMCHCRTIIGVTQPIFSSSRQTIQTFLQPVEKGTWENRHHGIEEQWTRPNERCWLGKACGLHHYSASL